VKRPGCAGNRRNRSYTVWSRKKEIGDRLFVVGYYSAARSAALLLRDLKFRFTPNQEGLDSREDFW
jgi:hypothetical protein